MKVRKQHNMYSRKINYIGILMHTFYSCKVKKYNNHNIFPTVDNLVCHCNVILDYPEDND